MSREDLKKRIDGIERSYEFLLAYAAQGLRTDQGAKSGGELRESLNRLDRSLDGLAEAFREMVEAEKPQSSAEVFAFLEVLESDQASSLAAVRLVGSRDAISSRLVDSLNASGRGGGDVEQAHQGFRSAHHGQLPPRGRGIWFCAAREPTARCRSRSRYLHRARRGPRRR